MINLAGVKTADDTIREELYLAGIPMRTDLDNKSEVPYTLYGKIGNWTFRRAWYYWIVSAETTADGLPLDIALKFHNTPHPTKPLINLGETVRVGGHCGCPSPEEYGSEPVYDDNLHKQLIALGYKMVKYEHIDGEFINAPMSDIRRLRNEGKIQTELYVDGYHVDDQVGLNELTKVIKTLTLESLK